MVDHGARYLIFASPSGSAKKPAEDTIRLLEGKGATVLAFACDVSDFSSVERVIHDAAETFPSICGVIQMAMVMRVSSRRIVLPNIC